MKFVVVAKNKITQAQKKAIFDDVAQSNLKSRRQFSKMHRATRNRATNYILSKIPFLSTLPAEAEYFSSVDFFNKVRFYGKTIAIDVDDIIIHKIEQSQILGVNELSKIKQFFNEKMNMEVPRTINSVDGLRKEIINAIRDNGVEVDG